jgi:hypothetical protein
MGQWTDRPEHESEMYKWTFLLLHPKTGFNNTVSYVYSEEDATYLLRGKYLHVDIEH